MIWRILTRHKWVVSATASAIGAATYAAREIPRLEALWTTSDGSGYPGYYSTQAQSMFSGNFDVPVSVLGDECYLVDGLCLGYFGIGPSIVRIPLVLVWGTNHFTGLLVGIAYVLLVGASTFLVLSIIETSRLPKTRNAPVARALLVLAALLACGPSSIALLATRADVANEAILWCALWTTLAAIIVLRNVGSGRTAVIWALPFVTLASLSRPVGAAYAVALGLGSLLVCLHQRPVRPGALIASTAITFAGPLAVATSFILKFGSILPPANAYVFAQKSSLWKSVLSANDGSSFRVEFMPSQLWAYLRLDALEVKWDFPRGVFYTPVYSVWPLEPGSTLVEPAPSLTLLAPAAMILLLIGLCVPWIRSSQASSRLRAQAVVLLVLPLGLLPILVSVAFSARYLVDAAPLLTVGSGIGAAVLLSRERWGPFLRLSAGALLALAIVGYGLLLVAMR